MDNVMMMLVTAPTILSQDDTNAEEYSSIFALLERDKRLLRKLEKLFIFFDASSANTQNEELVANLLICVNIYKVKCTFTKRGLSKKDICANECVGKKGLALDINRPTWIFTFCSEFRNGGLKRIEISHLVLGVFTQSCWIL